MEKLFLSLSRWLMLVGAAAAFVFLIGGSIYVFKLYQESIFAEPHASIYSLKNPKVSFKKYKSMYEQRLKEKLERRKRLEQYIEDIIKNGSSGHNYKTKIMPSGIIREQNVTEVARYVADRLGGKRPTSFNACAACHGDDGEGMDGSSPSLLILPIYHGFVSRKGTKESYAPSSSAKADIYADPLKKYSAEITTMINKYAMLVDQNGSTVEEIYQMMLMQKNKYELSVYDIFKKQLTEGVDALLEYAKNNGNFQHQPAILWRSYLEWFVRSFDKQYKAEKNKYANSISIAETKRSNARVKAIAAKSKMMEVLMALGIALIAFILITMILVLFKIEINTRKE